METLILSAKLKVFKTSFRMKFVFFFFFFGLLVTGYSLQNQKSIKVAQFCLTMCDPADCSPPGSYFYGILQGRILEWEECYSDSGSVSWIYVNIWHIHSNLGYYFQWLLMTFSKDTFRKWNWQWNLTTPHGLYKSTWIDNFIEACKITFYLCDTIIIVKTVINFY